MKRRRLAILATILIGAAFATMPLPVRAQNESPPISDSQIPSYIIAAVNSPDRPAADKALDAGRKPAQMLAFFGIKPGMKVVDLSAGAGYTTELLALVVGPTGKVYSQNPDLPQMAKMLAAWHERLKQPALSNVVAIEKPADDPNLLPVFSDSLDAVIINMNYHDLVHYKVNTRRMNKYIFRMLKKAGVYGIIDNSAQAGSGTRDVGTLHRIDERYVINQVAEAGFRLDGSSSALRNPNDNWTWLVFKHRGQQDRFMLKFVKPFKMRANPL
ncbi:MAG TPA: class I SAM-dependent methyltransferase [Candidatus Binataceae bacterium]|nr:class I SAM-dependent methyltransferase [Candidatus Binataceae bacterium]